MTLGSVVERLGRINFNDPNWEHRPYRPSQAHNQSKLAILLFTAEVQRRLDAAGSHAIVSRSWRGCSLRTMSDSTGRECSFNDVGSTDGSAAGSPQEQLCGAT